MNSISLSLARVCRFALLGLSGAVVLQAHAQSPGTAVGLGLTLRQPIHAGTDHEVRAVPLLFYSNGWFRVTGLQADAELPRLVFSERQALAGGLRVRYEDEGYEPGDSPALAGMARRRASWWAGVAASWHNPLAELSFEWMADASGHSDGSKSRLRASRRWAWERVALTPRVQADWLSGAYVDYYYGVRDAEAAPGRPAYRGGSALVPSIGLRVDYSIAGPHQVFVDLGLSRLPGEIEDSPIVDRGASARASVGYLYRF